MTKFRLAAILLFSLVFMSDSWAGEVTWLEENYHRVSGKPEVLKSYFSADPGTGQLKIVNGDAKGTYLTASARVSLNGQQIFGPKDFKKAVTELIASVPLQAHNYLEVQLAGQPGSNVRAEVTQEVDSDMLSGVAKMGGKTKVLGGEASGLVLSLASDQSSLLLDASVLDLLPLEVGDILIVRAGSTPALLRITEIVDNDTELFLATEPASLADAIESCSISMHREISPGAVEAVTRMDGVEFYHNSPFVFPMSDVIIYDLDGNNSSTADQVVANGFVSFEYTVDFDIVIEHHRLAYVKFDNYVAETCDLELSVGGSLNVDSSKTVAEISLPGFWAWILYIKPEIDLVVGATGSVKAEITTGISQNADISVGVEYAGGAVETMELLRQGFQRHHSFAVGWGQYSGVRGAVPGLADLWPCRPLCEGQRICRT